ncbi:MAG: HAMP domain-containing histidine kinase [Bacteroidales bacterium]|nr:HAMP domain-containing histidine kinase [Bacteroidales bacterium]
MKTDLLKDRLLQIMSHDVKNLFNTILGYSDLLKTKYKTLDSEKLGEMISIIDHSSRNCFALIDSLSDWAIVQGDKFNPQLQKTNLHDLVQKIVELYSYAALRKEIQLINSIDYNLEVSLDTMMIMTVLRNFLSNAIKFSYHNGNIDFSARIQDNTVFISIKDNGIGMTNEEIRNLLTSNQTSKPGTDNEKGQGIGFILCKDLISLHNGNLFVESKPNSGTTITFSIPKSSVKFFHFSLLSVYL